VQEAAEAGARRRAIGRDRDHVLQLQMLEQLPVRRAVAAFSERLAKASRVQAPRASLALEQAVQESHVALRGKKLDDLVIQALVDQVTVGVVEPADGLGIPQDAELPREPLDLLAQGTQFFHAAHDDPPLLGLSGTKGRRGDSTKTETKVDAERNLEVRRAVP